MRRIALIALLLVLPVSTQRTEAQSSSTLPAPTDTTHRKRLCFRGRPQPTCDRFWLTEFGVAAAFLNEGVTHAGPLYTWELGGMINVAEKHALGAAVFAEAGYFGDGLGLRPRYRHWLSGGGSFDIAVGAAIRPTARPAFSGHVAFNLADYAAATLHVVSIRQQVFGPTPNGGYWTVTTRARPVLYAGGRLGGKAGSIAGIVVPLGLALLYLSWCSNGCD